MQETPLFGAFHALAIDEAGCGAGFARGFLSALDVEHMMDAIQRAIPVPQAKVIMHGASGRQLLGQCGPLIPPGLPGGINGSICAHSSSLG